MYIFSNVLGVFVFDGSFQVVDELLFKNGEDYQNREHHIEIMQSKYKNLEYPDETGVKNILLHFKNAKFLNGFYERNLQLTKSGIRNSVGDDTLLVQAINSIGELDIIVSRLAKRFREWYELYNPETSVFLEDNERFIKEILEKEKKDLLKELNIDVYSSMGADFKEADLVPIMGLARQIGELYQLRENLAEYASKLMDRLCPNVKAICGTIIGAKLIEHAGSLKRLSEMPASTIQILGAENALFRHMRTGSKPPRHGIIANHPLISRAPNKLHGKIARALADRVCIASKVDYFHGKFIGDRLNKELEDKFGAA